MSDEEIQVCGNSLIRRSLWCDSSKKEPSELKKDSPVTTASSKSDNECLVYVLAELWNEDRTIECYKVRQTNQGLQEKRDWTRAFGGCMWFEF